MINDTSYHRTPQNIVNDIYEMLYLINNLFISSGVKYSIICGTLLGAMRHKGLIPWDDDADIAIMESDYLNVFRLFKQRLSKTRFDIAEEAVSLKVYSKDGVNVGPLKKALFPFTDIFSLHENQARDKYHYANKRAHEYWPDEYILIEEWERIDVLLFGDLKLFGLNEKDAIRYLDNAYGSNWMNKAHLTFNHVDWKDNEKSEVDIVTTTCAMPSNVRAKD